MTGAEAEVRVFPPVPLDGWPKELVKLQVSGTDLDDPAEPGPVADGRWCSGSIPGSTCRRARRWRRPGTGAQLLWWAMADADRKAWKEAGFPLAVRTATPEHWTALTASGSGLPVVRDAGFTEIAPGKTVVSEGSHLFASHLRLRQP
ncbi:peptidyl-tRNA hydrolase [Streptomyces narbonensis]